MSVAKIFKLAAQVSWDCEINHNTRQYTCRGWTVLYRRVEWRTVSSSFFVIIMLTIEDRVFHLESVIAERVITKDWKCNAGITMNGCCRYVTFHYGQKASYYCTIWGGVSLINIRGCLWLLAHSFDSTENCKGLQS